MHKARKSKAFNKEVTEMAELKERVAQLEGLLAKQKTCSCSTKPLDVYRRKLYNEMVDNHLNLMKLNHKVIHKVDIKMYSLDSTFNPSIALLREFGRRRMTKSPQKLKNSKYSEKWHRATLDGRLQDKMMHDYKNFN